MAKKKSCRDCNRAFTNQAALTQHLSSSIHAIARFRCRECNRDFVSKSALTQHRNSSIHRPTYSCHDCDRNFSNKTALQQHLKDKAHKPQRSARARFFCQKCNRQFGDNEALRKHLASVIHHPLIQDVKCISGGSCNKRFSSPSAMLHHFESGACSSGITRRRIDQVILERDTGNIITSQNSGARIQGNLLMGRASDWNSSSSFSSSGDIMRYAPTSSIYGGFSPRSSGILNPTYSVDDRILGRMSGKCSCPICGRKFSNPQSLRTHIYSPAHSPKIYHCPLPLVPSHLRGNGKLKNFSTLSGLAQHLESGACKGGRNTFRKAMGLVNGRLRELGFADMRLIR